MVGNFHTFFLTFLELGVRLINHYFEEDEITLA